MISQTYRSSMRIIGFFLLYTMITVEPINNTISFLTPTGKCNNEKIFLFLDCSRVRDE